MIAWSGEYDGGTVGHTDCCQNCGCHRSWDCTCANYQSHVVYYHTVSFNTGRSVPERRSGYPTGDRNEHTEHERKWHRLEMRAIQMEDRANLKAKPKPRVRMNPIAMDRLAKQALCFRR